VFSEGILSCRVFYEVSKTRMEVEKIKYCYEKERLISIKNYNIYDNSEELISITDVVYENDSEIHLLYEVLDNGRKVLKEKFTNYKTVSKGVEKAFQEIYLMGNSSVIELTKVYNEEQKVEKLIEKSPSSGYRTGITVYHYENGTLCFKSFYPGEFDEKMELDNALPAESEYYLYDSEKELTEKQKVVNGEEIRKEYYIKKNKESNINALSKELEKYNLDNVELILLNTVNHLLQDYEAVFQFEKNSIEISFSKRDSEVTASALKSNLVDWIKTDYVQ
jgi:hypothetical protein